MSTGVRSQPALHHVKNRFDNPGNENYEDKRANNHHAGSHKQSIAGDPHSEHDQYGQG